jgi:hypothetical protein
MGAPNNHGLATTWLLVLAVAGCTADNPPFTASPDHGTTFGQYDVTLTGDFTSLGDISQVTFAGIRAYDLRPIAGGITVTVQGAPDSGPAQVTIQGAKGHATHSAFSYDPPATGVPTRWLAFGASLTQGFQSFGLNVHSQLSGVSGVIGRQAGVFLAIPLFADGVAPGFQFSDFTPACASTKQLNSIFDNVLAALQDPSTGVVDLARGRVDPTLQPRNIAIGGSLVSDMLNGAQGPLALIEHLVEDPTTTKSNDILVPVAVSQLDHVEALDPDVGFVTDLMANDIDRSITGTDLDASLATPVGTLAPLLNELAGRIGALHGQYFIANLAYETTLPSVAAIRAARIAAGTDTPQSFEEKVKQADALTDAYNDALAAAVAPYSNIHLVDFRGHVQMIAETGVIAGGEWCTVAHFGGLLSLDDEHFTDTGYAVFANGFIEAINQQLGTAIPYADVDAIHATDALSPSKLRAAGFTCVPAPGGLPIVATGGATDSLGSP